MAKAQFNPHKNAWNLMKQMADEYSRDKKYLTRREIKYIIKTCERSLETYTVFNPEYNRD